MPEKCDVLIIGGGPAGLRAAEITSASGLCTVLADRMPSVGRKFLVAGRGGLNLTHSEPLADFISRYGTDSERWASLLADCSPEQVRDWARGLGIETFVGTSGRVFPEHKQAAPLLRRWLSRLRAQGVDFRLRHRWIDFQASDGGYEVHFATPSGKTCWFTRSLILACGGASWPQTGSDAVWFPLLQEKGLRLQPLTAANCGYEVAWPPDFFAVAEGLPLKNIVVSAHGHPVAGELLITRYGLEGGALYQLGSVLRAMPQPEIILDLKPTFSAEALAQKLPGGSLDLASAARAWKLNPVGLALLKLSPSATTAGEIAQAAKSVKITLARPRPIEEAISTSGGIAWEELEDSLMIKTWPGVFAAGEMIAWDAPTGGYLLQGCLATGLRAGQGTITWLKAQAR